MDLLLQLLEVLELLDKDILAGKEHFQTLDLHMVTVVVAVVQVALELTGQRVMEERLELLVTAGLDCHTLFLELLNFMLVAAAVDFGGQ